MATFNEYMSAEPTSVADSLFPGLKINGDQLEKPLLVKGATLNTDGYGLRIFNGTFLFKNNAVSPNLAIGWEQFKDGAELFFGTRLFVTKTNRRFTSGGMVEVEVEALGIDQQQVGGYVTLPCTEGAGSTAATPIEAHPDFEMKIGGTYKDRKNGAIFDPQTKKFTGFSTDTTGSEVTSLGQSLAGVRTYLDPRRVIRGYIHGEFGTSAIGQIPQEIGNQSQDGIFLGIRLVPEWQLPANSKGGTFLLTSANIEPLANITQNYQGTPKLIKLTYELTASGPSGWNKLIYQETKAPDASSN